MSPYWTGSAGSTTTADTCAYYPNNSTASASDTATAWIIIYHTEVAPTEEELRARLEREREYRKQQELATKRAEELLKEYIGLAAFGKLYEVGYIEVDSRRYKGRKYRVPDAGFIEVIDKDGQVIDRLCIHPRVQCPLADQILSKIVLLELDEEYVLDTANHH